MKMICYIIINRQIYADKAEEYKLLYLLWFELHGMGAECWTWNMKMKKRLDAFEMWCYRRMLKISWKEKVSDIEILKRVDES